MPELRRAAIASDGTAGLCDGRAPKSHHHREITAGRDGMPCDGRALQADVTGAHPIVVEDSCPRLSPRSSKFQCVTPAKGSSSWSSAVPGMATGTDSNCPICQETWDDMASALPCRHQFCLGCILRWATTNPSCPLCRTLIETVRFSERGEQDYVQFVITARAEPAETSSQPERAPHHLDQSSLHGPVVSPAPSAQGTLIPAEQRPPEPEPVGGLQPEVWAGLFRQRQLLLEPVRPWLRRRLQGIFRERWWLAEVAESSILRELCLHGPDAAMLVLRLQHYLEEHTAPLVRGLVGVIAGRCSKEAKRRLRFWDFGEDSGSSSSSCSGSRDRTPERGPAGPGVQEEAGTSQSSLQESHGCAHPAPCPAERERPRRSRRGTGPCARGCVCCSSPPGQDRCPF